VDLVRQDLEAGLKSPKRGRKGLDAQVVLRALVLWRVKNLSYRELRERIADGYEMRRFVRLRGSRVPTHVAFQRAFNRVKPSTVKEIIRRIIDVAREMGLDNGARVRIDGTVVESNIHHPTDAWLMWDVVRVLVREVKRLRKQAPAAFEGFHDRTRRTKRLFFQIQRPSRKKRRGNTDAKYRELIKITSETLKMSAQAVERARTTAPLEACSLLLLEAYCQEIERVLPLGRNVVDQARRRIIHGEKVPAKEKIVSIFEPHTDIIVRNKPNKPVEFGHKVMLAETAVGMIFHHDVPPGNPSEKPWVPETLESHKEIFERRISVFAADRGFYSAANVKRCKDSNVKLEAIPFKGGRRPEERTEYQNTPKFKAAQRFRNGVEGRISGLARGRGMGRCRLKGRERFNLFVAASILASNLMCLAKVIRKKADQRDTAIA
jgi:IS5 family transposase